MFTKVYRRCDLCRLMLPRSRWSAFSDRELRAIVEAAPLNGSIHGHVIVAEIVEEARRRGPERAVSILDSKTQ